MNEIFIRQIHDLIIPKFQTSTGQKTLKFWQIKLVVNIRDFKLELEKHIFSNYSTGASCIKK